MNIWAVHRLILSLFMVLTLSVLSFGANVLAATPTLTSLNSIAIMPGATLTVTGRNFSGIASWTAVVELQSGEKFEQPVKNVTGNQFSITVPNVYNGYNVTSKNTEHRKRIMAAKVIYVKQGSAVSNKLGFNIISGYPILDSAVKTPAYAGDTLFVTGGNWDKNLLLAPSMYWAVFEYLPGKTVKTNLMPHFAPLPPVPVPFMPNTTLVGAFSVKVPDVYSGKSAAEQAAISNSTAKLTIYGLFGPSFTSNPLDVKILKKGASGISVSNAPNPCKVPLAAYYAPSAPNRTMFYKGSSQVQSSGAQKALITGVKNTCNYTITLTMKSPAGSTLVGNVSLNPGQTTSAFNGKEATAAWEALGPESGSFLNKYPQIGIEVSWK